ncbi:hypothetical protein DPEC_G00239200 [Dallia pectoralis]|uniref:Uncharacterized protein n=1 Tax=Dallia pectoralis TaxID=75939 RepID=A0ACC2FZC5_DALPE|nr:hypothetical protein DPEC_G00239200 [Dallia pectoralis]
MEDTTGVELIAMEQSEPQEDRSSLKIDLSLDDIIKLSKKEHKANQAANRTRGRRMRNKSTALRKLERAGPQIFTIRHGGSQFPQGKLNLSFSDNPYLS